MSISVIRGTNDKPVASRLLAEKSTGRKDWSGKLFIGYPIVAGTGGPHRVDALLVSNERGLVVFDLIECSDLGDFRARQDEAANLLDASCARSRASLDDGISESRFDHTGSIRISHEARIASWSLIN